MKKILKFVLPATAFVSSITPFMVGCSNSSGIIWNYIVNGNANEFKPSTAEKDLPTGSKTLDDATQFYYNNIKNNSTLMVDDFLTHNNNLLQLFEIAKQNYIRISITIKNISWTDEKYPSPMILLSYRAEEEIHMENNGETLDIISRFEYTNYPYWISKISADQPWMLQPVATITEQLEADIDWHFSIYASMIETGETPQIKQGEFDHNIGTAPQEKQGLFTSTVTTGAFSSYYLSKIVKI